MAGTKPNSTSFRVVISAEERFWQKVDRSGGQFACWQWTGSKRTFGYGHFRAENKRRCDAHRFSWEIHRGAIPHGMCVCHSCDNPSCVNPAHLWLGTSQQNTADRHIKGRDAAGDVHYSRTQPERLCRGERHPNFGKPETTRAALVALANAPERRARGGRHWARRHPEKVKRGKEHHNSLPSDVRENATKLLRAGASVAITARSLGIGRTTVCRIKRSLQ